MSLKSSERANAQARPDRRVARTKRQLSKALIELILEKGYEHVTIQDILDRADVGRSTFYAHYESKDVLLVDGPRNLGLSLFGESVDAANTKGAHPMAFRAFFEHVNENRPLAKAMLGKSGGAIIVDAFRAQIAAAIRRHYASGKASSVQERRTYRYLAEAAAAAVASLLSSWADDDFVMPVDDVWKCCQWAIEGVFRPLA
jgi:AcrR family transcriptional regulator